MSKSSSESNKNDSKSCGGVGAVGPLKPSPRVSPPRARDSDDVLRGLSATPTATCEQRLPGEMTRAPRSSPFRLPPIPTTWWVRTRVSIAGDGRWRWPREVANHGGKNAVLLSLSPIKSIRPLFVVPDRNPKIKPFPMPLPVLWLVVPVVPQVGPASAWTRKSNPHPNSEGRDDGW